ncbi:MAG: PfkB family carbohydrate kinase [Chloroflexota bacterium]|nr:PfkB family carbohydrate kinase [Anaerolineae bacterium]
MPRFDVVGLGCCAWDYLAVVEEYPPIDTKTDTASFSEQGGGPTATALVTLARLGAKTLFVGKVGDDVRGRLIVEQLEAEGVDVTQVRIEKDKSSRLSFSIVERKTGKRTIVSAVGSVSPLAPEDLDRKTITSGRILHVDGHQMEAAIHAAKWAREADVKVILDAGSFRPGMEALVKLADYVVASETFALNFTSEGCVREAARKLFHEGQAAVVVTTGDKGGFCVSDGGEFAYPTFRVEVVDTTGAGDVFHGAFDYGILRGWDLEEVVRFSSAVAALKCRELGGRAGIPSLNQVRRFLTSA